MTKTPAKTSKNWLLWLIPVVAVMLAVGLFWGQRRSESKPKDDPSEVARVFLEELRTGDRTRIDAAWDSATSTEFKSYQGKEKFRQVAMTTKALRQPAEFQNRETENRGGHEIDVLRYTAGGRTVRIDLAGSAGQWRVERFELETK